MVQIDRLELGAGQRLFIEGPSGSGKSTLLSLLAGVTVPQQGTVRILETSLDRLRRSQRDRFRADHIGYIFQMFNLIPYLSVLDNVLLPCRFSTLRRQRTLRQATSLDQEARRLLARLDIDDSLLDRPVTALSVGQQQRVAAARALIGMPELLIADEPTSSLDRDRQQVFVELLFEECQRSGSALVLVSHDTTLAERFDRSVRLTDINRTKRPVTG